MVPFARHSLRFVRVSGAFSAGDGGAVSVSGSAQVVISHCPIARNSGDGLAVTGRAQARISYCTIARSSGDGLAVTGRAQAGISYCTIIGNTGRGVDATGGAHITVEKCLIASNGANGVRAAVRLVAAPTVVLKNCTIARNNSLGTGAPIFVDGAGVGAGLTVSNCVIWGSTTPNSVFLPGGMVALNVRGAAVISLQYSDVQNSAGRRGNISADPLLVGSSISADISADPLFVDPAHGDYRLLPGSPCIDAGDPHSPKDPDGTRADMGAFPFDQRAQSP